jgi:pteridine reductase
MAPARVALVTGSGKRRVGSVVADALAERGYAIAVHYRTSAAEAAETAAALRARGVEVETFPADLADESAVRGLVDATLARFGRIDVLVNCAAIWQRKRLEEVTAADVRRHFDTNALSTFLCAQQAGLAMAKQPEGGLIVNLGDWAEVRPYLDYSAYFPSKGAVTAMTRSLAVELAHRNPRVRVNCILPGPVMLPPDLPEAERRQSINGTLVKREGSPRHIALAVLSFVDNDFITGVCLPVDGGRTVYAPE